MPDPVISTAAPAHWPEYAAEFVGTALLVLGGLSAVTVDFAPGLPMLHWLPSASMRRLLTGLLFAGSGSLIAISPLGKLSGAHLNPAVSLAFWVQGKMHGWDSVGYVLSQLAGGIAGVWLLDAVWGDYAHSIHDGVTVPGLGYTALDAFGAEVVMTFMLIFSILLFVSNHKLMRWTPLMTWFLVALLVWLGAPVSGTSLNPARSFGPAFITGVTAYQWIYWLGPLLGSLGAVATFRFVPGDVLTGKLFHVASYRSIFKHVAAPSRKEAGLT